MAIIRWKKKKNKNKNKNITGHVSALVSHRDGQGRLIDPKWVNLSMASLDALKKDDKLIVLSTRIIS